MAAQVTITQLPTAGAITGSELVPIVQNGVTVQTTTGAIASGGAGTVTSVSVASANGFAGTVASATSTPAITVSTSVTGLLKGNGTAVLAATANTDYQSPITLTTTGTSGAATFVSNTLNIPQYSGGGGSGTVTSVSVVSANGFAGSVATATTTPAITVSTSITGLLKGNGTAISAATSGTDYAPATSGSAILYGNGSGGFSSVTIGTGLSFTTGTLSSTASGGTVTSVGFTGGLITVATATTTPALTVAGTSGGFPYFSSASTWASSAALTQYGIVYGGGAASAPVSTAAGTTGQVLTATTGGAPTWAAPATSGTVTSVGFTGGIITVATATSTPAFTVAGTSGGIPYFSSGTTWATSAALAANALVVGGGAGAAPATVTTGTGVVTALGVNTGSSGAFATQGGAIISATTINDSAGTGYAIGYRQMPQNSQTGATYTLVLADDGKHIYLNTGSVNALTVPTNASVAFVIGTVITVVNGNSGICTITGPASGLQLANGTAATTRLVATKGMATMVKVATDLWYVSGAGVT
jgi:hypothetical protein